jgi:hypothetical protein
MRGWTEGIVLRYGAFYGPGTGRAPGEDMYEMIRKRRFPLVGDGRVVLAGKIDGDRSCPRSRSSGATRCQSQALPPPPWMSATVATVRT